VFREGLAQLGWTERNVRIELRFAGGNADQMQGHAAELVGSAPDVIVANSTPVLAALKQATRTALVFNPQTAPYYPAFLHDFKAAPAALAAELSAMPVRDEAEIGAAVSAFAREPGCGLIVAPDPFMSTRRAMVIALAERQRLPALFGARHFVRDCGLISYGPDTLDIVRRSASYVDRVLKGERPSELPVQAPAKYELLINLNTAKTLGLTVPTVLRVRANEVIE
jgi:putative tryptophan/tyrosine transport system substrate-binding protein